jgi:hypothetical protein
VLQAPWGSVIDRVGPGGFAGLLDRSDGFVSAAAADGNIEGDAVQPGIKSAISLELLQVDKGLHERFLHDVLGLFGRADNMHHGIVEPILVFCDQIAKAAVRSERLINQWASSCTAAPN